MSRRLRPAATLHLAAVAFAASPALAQTWDGGSIMDSNWTTPANWNPDFVPLSNGTVNIIFAGTLRLGPVLNVAPDVASVTFNNTAGAFTLIGVGPLTIRAGGVTNNDTQTQNFNIPVIVQAPQTWNSAAGGLTFSGTGGVTLNADVTINATSTVLITSGFFGTGAITKTGAGTLSLNAASAHSGATIINAGTVLLGANNVLSDSSAIQMGAAGILDMNDRIDTIPSLAGSAGAVVDLGMGMLTVNAASGTFTYSGSINGSGGFAKNGASTQVFGGANTYNGLTEVNAGTLQINASDRLSDFTNLDVAGGTFAMTTFSDTVESFRMTAGSISSTTGTLSTNGFFDIQGGTISARLGGNADLTKSNAATNVVFNRSGSTYTGQTIITAGDLVTNAADVLPDTTVVSIGPGGELHVTNFDDTVAGITGTGSIVLVDATLSVGAGNASSLFGGVISESSIPSNLTKIGTGALLLSGNNTYTGTTTVSAGILIIGADERLANSSDLNVAGGVLDLGAFDETVDLFFLSIGSVTGTGTLAAGSFEVRSGSISARLIGTGALTKSTSGTVTLSGANSYTGGTSIQNGVLEVNTFSNLGSSAATVALDGGTLRVLSTSATSRPFSLGAASALDIPGEATLSGPLIGPFALNKAGAGTLFLSSAGIFQTAGLNVNAGTVSLLPGTTYTTSAVSIVALGGALGLDAAHLVGSSSITNSGEIDLANDASIGSAVINNARLLGDGRINGNLTNNAPGDVRVGAEESLRLVGASTHSNAGLIEVISGSIEFDRPLTNAVSTGLIFARNATLRFNAGLGNAGSLALSFGATDIFGDINNQATGAIVLSGFANATFVDDVINNGIIRTSAGAASVFFGAVSGAGSFPGTGTVFMEGDLRPGNSPATIDFEGDLVFGSFATLQIELGGPSPTQFDRVLVDGDATLDGTLNVQLINGYHPTGVGSFAILGAGSRQQQFAHVNLPADARGLVVQYTPTEVRLRFCAADFNSDGVGNSQDFFDFLTPFFAASPSADFNHDGSVNSQDFFDFITAFFAGCQG